MKSQSNCQPGLQLHLKAQIREDLLQSSLIWLLPGLSSSQSQGLKSQGSKVQVRELKSSLDVYLSSILGLSYRETHDMAVVFLQGEYIEREREEAPKTELPFFNNPV